LVYSISEEKEQIDFRMNRLILQNTLTQTRLIEIMIEINRERLIEQDWLIFKQLEDHNLYQEIN